MHWTNNWNIENDFFAKIEKGIVYLDITGSLTIRDITGPIITGPSSHLGDGTIKGKAEIDIKSGVLKNSEVEMIISSSGVKATVTSKISMTKI